MGYLEKKRNAMLNSISAEQPPLPSEYQEVEYIRSTGTQYLNAILINVNMSVECQFSLWRIANTDTVWGSQNNNTGATLVVIRADEIWMRYFTSGGIQIADYPTMSALVGSTITVSLNKDYTELDVDGTSNTFYYQSSDITLNENIYIFGRNVNGAVQYCSSIDMYYFKIYDRNKNIIFNLIPCYRKSDNEIGMYDTVNQTFYTNQGTGTFLKGSDV